MAFKPPSHHLRVSRTLFEANRLMHEKQYDAAATIYSTVIENTSHPLGFLNRALCFLAKGQPHLGVNDSLRAYMIAQHVLDEGADSEQAIGFYLEVRHYANGCLAEFEHHAPWVEAAATMLEPAHQEFKLAHLSIKDTARSANQAPEKEVQSGELTSASFHDLKNKAIFRLLYTLSQCGRGPSYTALQILDGVFARDRAKQAGSCLAESVASELRAVGSMIQDRLLVVHANAKVSRSLEALTMTRFMIINTDLHGLIKHETNYHTVNKAISSLDDNAIVSFACTNVPSGSMSLVATQDAFEGSVLFTEFTPFVVSTANSPAASDLAKTCDNCGAVLQIPSSFVLPVLAEEVKREDIRKAKKFARQQDEMDDDGIDPRPIPVMDGIDEDDEWSSEDCYASSLDTPPRGKMPKRLHVLEACDLQVCRSGREEAQENFSFCSEECHDLAMRTYHDSVCGSHIENYLRQSMITSTHRRIPTVDFQRLTLLLLVRILGWAYATSTDPLDLPVVQLLFASPRYPPLADARTLIWSFYQNVYRPMQIFQAMDGRAFAPKTAKNPRYSDGRVLNTLIALIQRCVFVSDTFRWSKRYDQEGYCVATVPCPTESHGAEQKTLWGRMHPLCDLVPVASDHGKGNVEFVDLGDGRIVCIPLFSENHNGLLPKGTPLVASTPLVRLATAHERRKYAPKYEDVIMADGDEDEAPDATPGAVNPASQRQEEEGFDFMLIDDYDMEVEY